jgi:hypothetical protein
MAKNQKISALLRSVRETMLQIDGIVVGAERQFVEAVNRLRQEIVLAVLDHGDFTASDLRRIRTQIESITRRYQTRFEELLSESQRKAFIKGIQLIDSAISSGGLISGLPYLSENKLRILQEYSAEYVTNITSEIRTKIMQEVNLAVLGQKSTMQVIGAIGNNLTDPSIFGTVKSRAETIVRTEMRRIQQISAMDRMKQSVHQVPDLQKRWLHSHASVIPRPNHLMMNGMTIPVGDKFSLVGRDGAVHLIDGPYDPRLPVGEIVNCGCMAIPVVARFEN